MAQRRRKRSTSTRRRKSAGAPRRRRRVGATALNFSANSPLVKWGSVALGYFFGDKVNEQLTKLVGDKLDPKLVAGGEVGLGFLLAMRKGKKNLLTTVGGGVLLGAGVKAAVTAFGIGGIGPYGRVPVVAGIGPYGQVPVLAGAGRRRVGNYSPNASLNGYSPSGSLASTKVNVMGGVDHGSGSSLVRDGGGSDLMN